MARAGEELIRHLEHQLGNLAGGRGHALAVDAVALVPLEVFASLPSVTVELRSVSLVATTVELTVNAPLDPSVPEVNSRVDSLSLVTTVAVTPMPAELMALASPASVFCPDVVGTFTVCALVSEMLEVTVKSPPLPAVPDVKERIVPAVFSEAVIPRLVELLWIVLSSVESVFTLVPV